MATHRRRGKSWHFVVRRKHLLPKPLYLTFASEEEGKAYVKKLEALLDRGIIPQEFAEHSARFLLVADVIRAYLTQVSVPDSDRELLNVLYARVGTTRLTVVDYEWVERWVAKMKHEAHLTPATIRHYVGALARCFDWAARGGHARTFPQSTAHAPKALRHL
jgi:hypothetical protein